MTDQDIRKLLIACAQGERTALNQLYQHESARLLGLIYGVVRNRAVAEDLLHDLFVKVWLQAEQYNPNIGSAAGWLSRIARNLALNAVRYQWRDSSLSEDAHLIELEEVHSRLSDPKQLRLQGESARLLFCLEQIEPEPRAAIINAYVHGLSHSELTEQLKAPLGTIKAWIKRSVQKLRECMS